EAVELAHGIRIERNPFGLLRARLRDRRESSASEEEVSKNVLWTGQADVQRGRLDVWRIEPETTSRRSRRPHRTSGCPAGTGGCPADRNGIEAPTIASSAPDRRMSGVDGSMSGRSKQR